MDPDHNATSIVPRPAVNCRIDNLIPYQAQAILRTLIVEEGERPKYNLLNAFIEQVCADSREGGTDSAVLVGVQFFDGRLSVEMKYVDVDGSIKPTADMAVYL